MRRDVPFAGEVLGRVVGSDRKWPEVTVCICTCDITNHRRCGSREWSWVMVIARDTSQSYGS